jgi:hypothetical protein
LTTEQAARFVIFQSEFEHQTRRVIKDIRQGPKSR